MKSVLSLIVLFLLSTVVSAQIANDLKKSFTSSDWKVVKTAKSDIENLQGAAMADLIELLSSDEKVKLANTGSLIYPGAERFFGHGQILEYDIDFLSIRAGWLIEEISFNNFGFAGIHLPKEELLVHIKITFPSYYNNSSNRKVLEDASDEKLRQISLELAVNAAQNWWEEEGDNWSRLTSLVEALRSFDEKRQVMALFYLRNGITKCDGLTRDYYFQEISKEIVRLNSSEVQRISEHAGQILSDRKLEWLDMKMQ
jgi:hypothetical protein